MRFTLRVLVAVAATAGAAHAAENWIQLPGVKPGVRFEVDAESVIGRGERVEFWERVEYATPSIKDEASLRLIKVKKVLRVMDCKARTQGLREAMAFSTDARLIEHVMLGGAGISMSPVPPGTIAEWQLDWACKVARTAR
ncbi:MAG: surface-adhesin E family protein [Burkholderiales bacterium]